MEKKILLKEKPNEADYRFDNAGCGLPHSHFDILIWKEKEVVLDPKTNEESEVIVKKRLKFCPRCYKLKGKLKKCLKCHRRFQPGCRVRFLCSDCFLINIRKDDMEYI